MHQNRQNEQVREIARRLLASETASSPQLSDAGASRVFEKLRGPFSTLAGSSGFRALLSRAIAVSRQQNPSLKEVRVNENSVLEGFEAIPAEQSAEAAVALIAQFIALLVTFIGEVLTYRLLLYVWPDLPPTLLEGNPTT